MATATRTPPHHRTLHSAYCTRHPLWCHTEPIGGAVPDARRLQPLSGCERLNDQHAPKPFTTAARMAGGVGDAHCPAAAI